jgi:hypothetical protein
MKKIIKLYVLIAIISIANRHSEIAQLLIKAGAKE